MNYFNGNYHTKKEVVFNQSFGLGDLLFIEPIYQHYHNKGYKVIAPVNDDLIWIAEYIPYVEFHKKSKFRYSYETVEQKNDGRLHLPTRFSHPLLRGYDLHYGDDRAHWMPDKYEYLGLDVELWRTLKWTRNEESENKLFDSFSWNIDLSLRYNFVNQHFGGSFEKVDITINNDLPNVYLKKIDGFSLLDWGRVIENAENIYTVETSVLYVVEGLNCKAKEFHLYPRYPFLETTDYMKPLLKDKWEYHTKDDL